MKSKRDGTQVIRGQKKPKAGSGELFVSRDHKIRGVSVAADHGVKDFDIEPGDAEVGASIERTVQPVQFESLKIGVSCRFPCSSDDLRSGKAFKVAVEMCRKEVSEQLERGLDGLESQFSK